MTDKQQENLEKAQQNALSEAFQMAKLGAIKAGDVILDSGGMLLDFGNEKFVTIIVERLWIKYDVDKSGDLDIKECRALVKEFVQVYYDFKLKMITQPEAKEGKKEEEIEKERAEMHKQLDQDDKMIMEMMSQNFDGNGDKRLQKDELKAVILAFSKAKTGRVGLGGVAVIVVLGVTYLVSIPLGYVWSCNIQ